MKILLTIFAIAVGQILSVSAQENPAKTIGAKTETRVPVVRQFGSRYFRCDNKEEIFRNAYEVESRTKGGEKCVNPVDLLQVDFDKQTLISYAARGDCFITARARVFRNEAAKAFRVQILKKSGGCRAGGQFDGWLAVEKIPNDYKVEFSETEVEDFEEGLTIDPIEKMLARIEDKKTVTSRQYDMNDCAQNYRRGAFFIKSEAELIKGFSAYTDPKICLAKLEKINFKKEILVGATVYSGYCRYPSGLKHQTIRDESAKKFTIFITYDDPYGRTCRALGMYNLWLAVPKPPADYEINFVVASVLDKKSDH